MYNENLINRICKAECYDNELETFCSILDKQEYDVHNSFDKYYSLDRILNVIGLYQQGKISNRYLTHWACAYLWIIQAELRVDEYYDAFLTLPMKEILKYQIIDSLDSLCFFDEDCDDDDVSLEQYIETFTDLDELYRTLPEWEGLFSPDDEFYDENIGDSDNNDYPDICSSWILLVHHGNKKFIRIYDDSFNCQKDNFEAQKITQDEMRNLETNLKSLDYTELGTHCWYDSLYANENDEDERLAPTSFNDEMRVLYDRICNLTCSLDDLKEFDALESDWEEGKGGEIKNFTTPYDICEPFRKYYNAQTVLKALDMFKNREIDRDFLKEWLKAYSQILQAQTLNTVFFISKNRKKKRHLVVKEESISSAIADLISDMACMLSPKKDGLLNCAVEALHIYTAAYRNIHDWHIVYSPVNPDDIHQDYCFHKVLFFNDRIQQFFVISSSIGNQDECYYEGVYCDKYDFNKIYDNFRSRKYKEIAIIKDSKY